MLSTTNLKGYTKKEAARDARVQLLSCFNGVLSTNMRDHLDLGGYPFGSVVPLCLDAEGNPLILISDLAQHTKNLNHDPRASITLHNTDQNNIQKGWRLTLIGEITPVEAQAHDTVSQCYERYYQESRTYHEQHDFNFYRMSVKKCRYINGFGMIHWVEQDQMIQISPFNRAEESEILAAMNHHYYHSLVRLLSTRTALAQDAWIRMVRVDQYGFTIAMDEQFYRFFFAEEAFTLQDICLRMAGGIASLKEDIAA